MWGLLFSLIGLTFVSFLSLLCFLYMYIPDFYKYIIWKVNLSVVLVCVLYPAFGFLSNLNPCFVCAPEYYPGVTLLAIAKSYPEVFLESQFYSLSLFLSKKCIHFLDEGVSETLFLCIGPEPNFMFGHDFS